MSGKYTSSNDFGLLKLIEEGEHIGQDFKQTINDYYKIAKTIVAFANTEGGRLLIGVKDNGRIVGVKPGQELYMIDYAAKKLCFPEVKFLYEIHNYNDKEVLEILIPESKNKPHYSIDRDNSKRVFVRVEDKTRLATKTMIDVMKVRRKSEPLRFKYTDTEAKVLEVLRSKGKVTLKELSQELKLPYYRIRRILVVLISMGVVGMEVGITTDYYFFKGESR